VPRDSHDILTDPPPPAATERLAYGDDPLQFGDLRLPPEDGPFALAVVLHGGYWQATYNLIHTGHMCVALAEAGVATWNVEYRRIGDVGGGWPRTGDDADYESYPRHAGWSSSPEPTSLDAARRPRKLGRLQVEPSTRRVIS
jgi:acetyl esterase/lipase